eukprot:Awhi_evm1s7115
MDVKIQKTTFISCQKDSDSPLTPNEVTKLSILDGLIPACYIQLILIYNQEFSVPLLFSCIRTLLTQKYNNVFGQHLQAGEDGFLFFRSTQEKGKESQIPFVEADYGGSFRSGLEISLSDLPLNLVSNTFVGSPSPSIWDGTFPGPPFVFQITKSKDGDHALGFGLHHNYGDMQSLYYLIRDLNLLYNSSNCPSTLKDIGKVSGERFLVPNRNEILKNNETVDCGPVKYAPSLFPFWFRRSWSYLFPNFLNQMVLLTRLLPKLTTLRFFFSDTQVKLLKELKTKVNDDACINVSKFSTNDVLSGIIWWSVSKARLCKIPKSERPKEVYFSCAVDVRKGERLKKKLPEKYFGNAICYSWAKLETELLFRKLDNDSDGNKNNKCNINVDENQLSALYLCIEAINASIQEMTQENISNQVEKISEKERMDWNQQPFVTGFMSKSTLASSNWTAFDFENMIWKGNQIDNKNDIAKEINKESDVERNPIYFGSGRQILGGIDGTHVIFKRNGGFELCIGLLESQSESVKESLKPFSSIIC